MDTPFLFYENTFDNKNRKAKYDMLHDKNLTELLLFRADDFIYNKTRNRKRDRYVSNLNC